MGSVALAIADNTCFEMTRRQGEADGVYFRSDRFYRVHGNYFFTTREGNEIGPFPTIDEAQNGLKRFVDCIQVNKDIKRAEKVALGSNWALANY